MFERLPRDCVANKSSVPRRADQPALCVSGPRGERGEQMASRDYLIALTFF
jgi:hypothetical protein